MSDRAKGWVAVILASAVLWALGFYVIAPLILTGFRAVLAAVGL